MWLKLAASRFRCGIPRRIRLGMQFDVDGFALFFAPILDWLYFVEPLRMRVQVVFHNVSLSIEFLCQRCFVNAAAVPSANRTKLPTTASNPEGAQAVDEKITGARQDGQY
jgi:hypothetical protein